jgi:uncharacterized protein YndB with AHSA1/START domain
VHQREHNEVDRRHDRRRCEVRIEAETVVERPPADVFAYVADGEKLPEYVTEFAWVRKQSEGEATRGTTYSYKMKRGAEGTSERSPGGSTS